MSELVPAGQLGDYKCMSTALFATLRCCACPSGIYTVICTETLLFSDPYISTGALYCLW